MPKRHHFYPQHLNIHCAYCGVLTRRDVPEGSDNFRTRDHILPRSVGRITASAVIQTVTCCRRCNQWRADLGHCAGLLRMALIDERITGHQDQPWAGTYRRTETSVGGVFCLGTHRQRP